MSENIESMMNRVDEMYSRININSELPPDEVLIKDAYSEMDDMAVKKKAEDVFQKQNMDAQGALRINNQLLARKDKVIDIEHAKERSTIHETSSFHIRISPKDSVKKTRLEWFVGFLVGCIAVFMPIIIM